MRVLIDVANGRVKDELVTTLQRAGHVVERGSAPIAHRRFDVVVVGSVELAERLHREHPTGAVIVFTRITTSRPASPPSMPAPPTLSTRASPRARSPHGSAPRAGAPP